MFNYQGTRNGAQRNLSPRILVKTSEVISIGDAVETYTSGTGENGTAALPLKGIVHAFYDASGLPIQSLDSAAGTANPSAVATVTGDGTQYMSVDTSLDSLYSATVSGTIGTTVDSELPGCRIDVDSANTEYGQLLETTATRTAATAANFYSHGVDPKDSTRLIVSLAKSEEISV